MASLPMLHWHICPCCDGVFTIAVLVSLHLLRWPLCHCFTTSIVALVLLASLPSLHWHCRPTLVVGHQRPTWHHLLLDIDAVLGVVVVICIGRRRYAMCLFAASDFLGTGNARHRGACGGDHPSTIVTTRGVVAVSGVAGAHRHPGSRFFVTQHTHGIIVNGPIVVCDVFVCGIAADRFGCCT